MQGIETCKLTLRYVRCELDESKTLEEAKRRVAELITLLEVAEKIEVSKVPMPGCTQ